MITGRRIASKRRYSMAGGHQPPGQDPWNWPHPSVVLPIVPASTAAVHVVQRNRRRNRHGGVLRSALAPRSRMLTWGRLVHRSASVTRGRGGGPPRSRCYHFTLPRYTLRLRRYVCDVFSNLNVVLVVHISYLSTQLGSRVEMPPPLTASA